MSEADDLDDLLAALDQKRKVLDEALALLEKEHAAGRTGLSAYDRAKLAETDYHQLSVVVTERIARALDDLTKS